MSTSNPQAGTLGLRAFVRDEGLSSRDPLRAAVRLAATATVFAAAAVVAVAGPAWYLWPVVWVAVAGAILSCGAAVHEAAHLHLFSSRWANHATGVVCSAMLGAPYVAYRDTHIEHHRFTHEPGDTDPLTILERPYQLVLGLPVYGFVYIGQLYAIAFAELVGKGPSYKRSDSRVLAFASLACQFVVFAAIAFAWTVLGVGPVLGAVVIPWTVAVIGILGVIALSEHYEMQWGPGPVTETTRSVQSNKLMRFAYWNTNYHCEHHLVPSVPCWNLPRVHEKVAPEVTTAHSYTGYITGLYGRLGRGELPEPLEPGT